MSNNRQISINDIPTVPFLNLNEFATKQRREEFKNGNNFVKWMEEAWAIEIFKYLNAKAPSRFIVWLQHSRKIKSKISANLPFIAGNISIPSEEIPKEKNRYYDIVIEDTISNKKHVFELKHQTGSGTAIDSINNYIFESDDISAWANRQGDIAYSIVICDYVDLGIYPNSPTVKAKEWNHKEYFSEKFYNDAKSFMEKSGSKVFLGAGHISLENLHSFIDIILEDMNVSWSN